MNAETSTDLLDRTMQWVEEEAAKPEESSEWDQNHWSTTDEEDPSCLTTMCFAGAAVTFAGYYPVLAPDYRGGEYRVSLMYVSKEPGQARFIRETSSSGQELHVINDKTEYVQDVARSCLGMTEREARVLFIEASTIHDVRRVVRQIKARKSDEERSTRLGVSTWNSSTRSRAGSKRNTTNTRTENRASGTRVPGVLFGRVGRRCAWRAR